MVNSENGSVIAVTQAFPTNTVSISLGSPHPGFLLGTAWFPRALMQANGINVYLKFSSVQLKMQIK